MKNKFTEAMAWIFTFLFFFAIFTSSIWLPPTVAWFKNEKPPETEQRAPISYEEVKQRVWLEQIKKADGSSVLINTEKLGDNVVPLIVRHYTRWTELGEVEYWVEVVE